MRFCSFLFLVLAVLFNSCKNDIDINAKYRDIAVVYGFIDQNQPVQYLRIQKLYQNSSTQTTGEGAQNPDSLYFDSLQVKVTDITNGAVYYAYRTDTIPKEPGFFSAAKNSFYTFSFPKNNAASELFALDVYYPAKDIHFTAKEPIRLVKDAIIPARKLVIKTIPTNYTFSYKFTSGINAHLYDLFIRFVYKEMDATDTTLSETKYVDYYLAQSFNYNPSSDYTINVPCLKYLEYLKESIPYNATKKRRTLEIRYHAYGGSKEFQDLQSLSKPNLSIVQKNQTYSNIVNGIGIFSSRNLVERSMEIDPSSFQVLANELPNFIP